MIESNNLKKKTSTNGVAVAVAAAKLKETQETETTRVTTNGGAAELGMKSKQLIYRKRSSHLNQSLNETDLSVNSKGKKKSGENLGRGRRNVNKKVRKKNRIESNEKIVKKIENFFF